MAGAVIGYEIFSPPAGIEENDPLLFNSPSSDEMIGSRHGSLVLQKWRNDDQRRSLQGAPPEMRIQCDAVD